MIHLTEKQRQAVLKGEAIRMAVLEIGEEVVLLRAAKFEHLQEALLDLREQQAVLATPWRKPRRSPKKILIDEEV